MKLKNRAFILRLTGTVLALVLLVYLLSQQGWDAILAAVQKIPIQTLILAFGLVIISRIAVVARWHVLLRASEMKIPFSQTFRITFAGLFATNFLPTTVGGDVVRLAGAVRLKYDAALTTASLIADRLVGMAGMALSLPWGIPGMVEIFDQIGSSALILPVGLAGIISEPKGIGKLWQNALRFGGHTWNALRYYLKKPGSLLQSLLYTGVHMFCTFTMLYILFKGEGETISWTLIAGLYSLVYFITLLPISINGYGLQEISMTFIFSKAAGVSMESSLSVALLLRTMMMLASLPGAFFVSGIVAGDSPGAASDDELHGSELLSDQIPTGGEPSPNPIALETLPPKDAGKE